MRFIAGSAAGKGTLFARSSTASRTADSEYLFRVEVLLHGGRWNRSTRLFKSSVRQRTPGFTKSNDGRNDAR